MKRLARIQLRLCPSMAGVAFKLKWVVRVRDSPYGSWCHEVSTDAVARG
jgi:hypothetical protein